MLSLGNLTAAIGRSYAIKARLKRERDAAQDVLDRKHAQARREFETWRQREEAAHERLAPQKLEEKLQRRRAEYTAWLEAEDAKRAVQREWVLQKRLEYEMRVAFEAEQELHRKTHARARREAALQERAEQVEAERLALKAAEPRIYRVGVIADLRAFNALPKAERQRAMKEKRVK